MFKTKFSKNNGSYQGYNMYVIVTSWIMMALNMITTMVVIMAIMTLCVICVWFLLWVVYTLRVHGFDVLLKILFLG